MPAVDSCSAGPWRTPSAAHKRNVCFRSVIERGRIFERRDPRSASALWLVCPSARRRVETGALSDQCLSRQGSQVVCPSQHLPILHCYLHQATSSGARVSVLDSTSLAVLQFIDLPRLVTAVAWCPISGKVCNVSFCHIFSLFGYLCSFLSLSIYFADEQLAVAVEDGDLFLFRLASSVTRNTTAARSASGRFDGRRGKSTQPASSASVGPAAVSASAPLLIPSASTEFGRPSRSLACNVELLHWADGGAYPHYHHFSLFLCVLPHLTSCLRSSSFSRQRHLCRRPRARVCIQRRTRRRHSALHSSDRQQSVDDAGSQHQGRCRKGTGRRQIQTEARRHRLGPVGARIQCAEKEAIRLYGCRERGRGRGREDEWCAQCLVFCLLLFLVLNFPFCDTILDESSLVLLAFTRIAHRSRFRR